MDTKITKSRKISAVESEIHSLISYVRNRIMISEHVVDEIIAGYTLPMLHNIIAELAYGITATRFLSEIERKYLMEHLFFERLRRLNDNFEWTEENRTRFLQVNNELFNACKKGWQEALDKAECLEEKIEKCDPFLKDYEIRIRINTYPKVNGVKRDIAEYVESYLAEETLSEVESISHCHYKKVSLKDKEFPKYIVDDSTNWNFEYFGDVFKDDYICYLVHCMLDTGVWCFKDIISIERVWIDIEVTHQYYTDIAKIKNTKKEK